MTKKDEIERMYDEHADPDEYGETLKELAHVATTGEGNTSRTGGPEQAGSEDLKSIDAQIAALRSKRDALVRAEFPTYEDFARLPLRHQGIGVIKSASDATVLIVCSADGEAGDWTWQQRLGQTVVTAVNAHEELAEVHEAAMAFVACVGDGDGDGEWTEAEIEGLRYLRAILAKVRA
jgi:hypothetical protein